MRGGERPKGAKDRREKKKINNNDYGHAENVRKCVARRVSIEEHEVNWLLMCW